MYQPQDDGGDPPNDELDLENTLDERDLDDRVEARYSPPEHPLVVGKFGTTGAEVRDGEFLGQRLAQETSDVEPPDGDGIGDLTRGEGELLEGPEREFRAGRLSVATARPGGRTKSSTRTWASTAARRRRRKRPSICYGQGRHPGARGLTAGESGRP